VAVVVAIVVGVELTASSNFTNSGTEDLESEVGWSLVKSRLSIAGLEVREKKEYIYIYISPGGN
jgi:hypothetical protein